MYTPEIPDLTSLIGLAGAPTVERMVQYLRKHWKLDEHLTAPVSLIIGVLMNLGLAAYLTGDLKTAFLVGILTGFSASGWHEITK